MDHGRQDLRFSGDVSGVMHAKALCLCGETYVASGPECVKMANLWLDMHIDEAESPDQ